MPNGDLEASLFDDGAAKVQEKSTKDSILALYGPSSQPPQQPMYGVPGKSVNMFTYIQSKENLTNRLCLKGTSQNSEQLEGKRNYAY